MLFVLRVSLYLGIALHSHPFIPILNMHPESNPLTQTSRDHKGVVLYIPSLLIYTAIGIPVSARHLSLGITVTNLEAPSQHCLTRA